MGTSKMGNPIATSVRHATSGAAKSGLGKAVAPSSLRTFSNNATNNLNLGSKATPIVHECRNISEGIVNGDFAKATVNAGTLGMTATIAGTSGGAKVTTSKLTPAFISGMSMGMIPFEEKVASTKPIL